MVQRKILRRDFIRQSAIGCAAVATGLPFFANGSETKIPTPTPAQVSWQDCELGIIYCFDLAIAAGRYDVKNNAYKEVFDPKLYKPEKLDTDQLRSIRPENRRQDSLLISTDQGA